MTTSMPYLTKWLLLACVTASNLLSACGDDKKSGSNPPGDSMRDGGASEDAAGASPIEPDCYTEPKTYKQIINACTDAEKVDKDPKLPLLLPNGELPPLP